MISITILTILVSVAQCRVVSETITSTKIRRDEGFMFIDRMLLGKGVVDIKIEVSLQTDSKPVADAYQLVFIAIPDALWDAYSADQCQKSMQFSQIDSRKDGRFTKSLVIDYKTLSVRSTLRFGLSETAAYNFVLTDCKKNLVNEYFNRKSRLYYQIDISNNGSNLAEDERKLGWLLSFFLATSALLLYVLRRGGSFSDHNEKDYPKINVQVSLYSRGLSLGILLLKHGIYWAGGKEYAFFQFMYLLFADVGDVMVLVLLGCLAFGWMARFKEHRDQQIYFPLAGMGAFMSVILTLTTKINDGHISKYHMYDTIPTYILMVLKIVAYFIFLIGVLRSASKKTVNLDLSLYFRLLGVFGTACYLLLFIIYYLASWVNRCEQETWVLLAYEWARTVILGVLAWQLCRKKSVYRKVCLVNKSFMEGDSKYL